ncbi:MAG TPA: M14 family zinc carboxypeptidase [Acidobacteriota bacterium]|nr:M14 family zinc carboxypeptidase [Acidobacteriota bacterium]
MEASSWLIGGLLCAALVALGAPPGAGDLYDVDVRQLAAQWEKERISPRDPYSLSHGELKRHLQNLVMQHPEVLRLETAGHSAEGRELFLVTLGTGTQGILLWSQMHGDEPTATCSLLDIFQSFSIHRQEPWVADILRKYTLFCIPMLNPDGAERRQRRNAQGVDINRDARFLQSPEGRLLKNLRDRLHPFLGFNLHNQNSLTTVGDTGRVATIALLAVAANLPSSDSAQTTDAQILTKQITAVLYDALSPFVYGHISRYDESFNPRAFGDNLTLWGTPIVLMESGGSPADQPDDLTVKLNYVGLLATLNSLATGKIKNANPAVFDSLKMNSDNPIFDIMLRNAWIFTGTGVPPFRGDVAVRRDARAESAGDSIIADLGDLSVYSAHKIIDCTGALVTPGLIAWDRQSSPLLSKTGDEGYLRMGITTVVETVSQEELLGNRPTPEKWLRSRRVNWGFLLAGEPRQPSAEMPLRLAEWFAAGGRGWVLGENAGVSDEARKIPGWFGFDLVLPTTAARFQVPVSLAGEPQAVLPRWTSEAARQFHIPRRGIIAPGAIADLVIWTCTSGVSLTDLRNFKPSQVIVNGETDSNPHGRFLGR